MVRGIELLDRAVRDESQKTRARDGEYRGRVPVVVAGERRMFDVMDLVTQQGSVGIASDVSDFENLRAELKALRQSHAETLDQLPTAVAIFDGRKRLQASATPPIAELWQIDPAFLEASPTDGEILDRLRHMRRLPEQADYRAWKSPVLEAYRSLEPREGSWYLPDGRTLRVVTNPNPDGGMTYLFDDVTERFHLETKFNAVMRVQWRDAGRAQGRRRGVRHRRAPASCSTRPSPACGGLSESVLKERAAYRGRDRAVRANSIPTMPPGSRSAAR